MRKLVKGIHSFQRGFFQSNKALFEKLATDGQNPETLFITCSDSRVVPNLITNAAPGDMFIVRNVGNVVPPPSLPGGVGAAIEYAVEALKVKDIVICGHTQCGAIEAVLDPDKMANLPMVRRWLRETERVREIVEERYANLTPAERSLVAVEENVLLQLEHLREFPFIAAKLEDGSLSASGWVFEIGTGQVYDFDPEEQQFVPLLR